MKQPEFPKYKTEKTALSWGCFCCTRPLDGPANKTDYAPGRGQYSAQCSHCHSYTWFDLEQTQ